MAALAGGVLVTDAVQWDGQLQAAAAESRAQLAQARADSLAGWQGFVGGIIEIYSLDGESGLVFNKFRLQLYQGQMG